MRLILALGIATGWLASLKAEDAKPLSAAEAIEQIGRPQVVVAMTVKAAKNRLEKRGIVYLDSEEDFADPKNLGVAISAEAAEKYKNAGVADPAEHFKGKTIRVTGCIMRFEERPYLPVHDPGQIAVVEKL
jgi:hypothetical protein